MEISSTTHANSKDGLAKDLGETGDDLGKKTRECDELRAKGDELERRLETLHDGPKRNEKQIQRLNSQVDLDANAIAHLANIVKDHRSNCLCLTGENGELRKRSNNLEGETLMEIASAKELLANVSSMTGQ